MEWIHVVAGGNDILIDASIKYSYDGSNWSNCTGGFTGTLAVSLAWSGFVWVACGNDFNMKYSYNGINWSNSTNSPFKDSSGNNVFPGVVAWNGNIFIAAAPLSTQPQFSYDGINWTNTGGTANFSYSLAYSQTLAPDIATQNLNIYSQKQPTYLTSTNQILATASSIVLNNTAYINQFTNRVGINNANPQRTLDIDGTVNITSTLFTNTTSSIRGSFSSIGINIPNPRFQLDINGGIQLSTDVARKATTNTWTTTSDRRIKTEIEDANVDICYSNIRDFKLRRYTYISSFITETKLTDKYRLGVIAQEVSTIIPKLVETSQGYGFDDLQSVNIDQLNWAHYGATKKLMQKVEDQEAKISTLLSANESLFSQMSTLLKNNI